MPVETFHLVIGVLFFAVWAIAGTLTIRQRDDNNRHSGGANSWQRPSQWR